MFQCFYLQLIILKTLTSCIKVRPCSAASSQSTVQAGLIYLSSCHQKNIAYSFNVALQSGYSSNSASQIREALRALEVSWTEWINTKSHLNGMVIINALLIGQI